MVVCVVVWVFVCVCVFCVCVCCGRERERVCVCVCVCVHREFLGPEDNELHPFPRKIAASEIDSIVRFVADPEDAAMLLRWFASKHPPPRMVAPAAGASHYTHLNLNTPHTNHHKKNNNKNK